MYKVRSDDIKFHQKLKHTKATGLYLTDCISRIASRTRSFYSHTSNQLPIISDARHILHLKFMITHIHNQRCSSEKIKLFHRDHDSKNSKPYFTYFNFKKYINAAQSIVRKNKNERKNMNMDLNILNQNWNNELT